jgi:hypothetical protein
METRIGYITYLTIILCCNFINLQGQIKLYSYFTPSHKILKEKSESHYLYDTHTTSYSHAHNIADPEIAQAVHLGKKALKDPHIMSILWNKFQNQNKIPYTPLLRGARGGVLIII